MKSGIPIPTLNRLPLYYREFRRAVDNGIETMNSKELGARLFMPDTQIRKDLSYLDEQGRQRVGYDTRTMASYLEDFLGLMDEKQAVLVGVGNLARALISYPEFRRYGLQFRALFDNDPDKIGSELAGVKIVPVERIENLVQRLSVRIGIITTPAEAAQMVADQLIAGGVIAIWNFAPITLKVPAHVYVVNENLAIDFAKLSHHVQKAKV
ncbi:MAG: redox-sensing transcriptional repressor Rex [Anaerolineae bacterium]|nr:redox-sensing transcriptional repressor Rex [Anaerolineae bacterium]